MMRHLLSASAIALGLLATVPRAEAAPDPRGFVGDLGNQGISLLGRDVSPDQRLAKFRQLFASDFDVPDLARFALGRYWRAYSPEQQQEFVRLFQDYTAAAYSERLAPYGGAQFRVLGVQQSGDETVVNSEVIRPSGDPVQVDWHLVQDGDGYKISDVYFDRVSMKVTQRDEFARIIENNGGRPEALLAVLRQQIREKHQPVQIPAAR
ncbi:MAG: ABC transporter substrate-binding protein [Alphaproteobacteria bacterium]|nr:ABC transporter substrate-binding protein [Alphaproteobacteria bacterium]